MSLQQVGRYSLGSKLGQGGMATVYQGFDPRFKRDVAIKLLPPEFLNTPGLRERFEREAQIIAMLEHPAIVPVYDYGEEGDRPYLVMRLMSGGSLTDRIQRGPLPLPDMVALLERLAPALDHAHSLHIVHRDLKPSNILFDAFGNPYISDYGIAKLLQASGTTSKTGLMGTPDYMAPEQVLGDKQIDGRADLYALGIMVYQMLTGRVPYDGDTPMSVAFKHVTQPPPQLTSVRPDLAPAFDTFMTKALAKDPAARFQTAAELLTALQRLMGVQPTVGRPANAAATMLEVGPGATVSPPRPPTPPPSPPLGYNQPSPPLGINQPAPSQFHQPTPLPVQPARAPARNSSRLLIIGILVVGVLGLGTLVLGGAAVAAYSYFTRPTATTAASVIDEPTPEDEATPNGELIGDGDLAVTEMRTYLDNYGYFHVVGLVGNASGAAATSIALTLRVTDSNGDSVLPPDDVGASDAVIFNPLLYTIGPGEVAPFDYYYDSGGADTSDWQPEIELTGFEPTEVFRAEVEVINDRVYVGADGTVWLTGELVNNSDSPVQVNTLAGAMLAGDGTVVAADASYNATRYLAAAGDENGADRTPFSISIDDSADGYDSVRYYADADQIEPLDIASDVVIDIQNYYVDDFGTLHIAANVINNGSQTLSISLVAGVYDVDGVVLDAAFNTVAISVAPDAVVPVSFDYFNAIYGDTEQTDLVDTYTIQVDRYWSYEANVATETLSTSADENSAQEGITTFTGLVDNTSGSDLAYASLILAVYDADGDLYSVNTTGVYPDGDVIFAGASVPYEISLAIPADLDTSDFSFYTYVEGYLP